MSKAGLKWIETDIDILEDGTPIVLHDATLDRKTDRSDSFYSLNADDLNSIDAGSWFGPEIIPTLAQLVAFMNTHKINANIELKGNEEDETRSLELVRGVVTELEKLDDEREVIIS